MKGLLDKFGRVFSAVIDGITVVGFVVMVLLIFINVCGRYIFSMGIVEAEEIARILFVWITYLGAILCFRSDSHVRVDIILMLAHGVPNKILRIIDNLLVSGILLVVTKASMKLIRANIKTPMPLTHISLGLIQIVIPLSMICMLIINVYKLVLIFMEKKTEE